MATRSVWVIDRCQVLDPAPVRQHRGASGDHQRRRPARRGRPRRRGSRRHRGRRRAPSSRPLAPRTGPPATAPDRPSARRTRVRRSVNSRSRIVGVRASDLRNRSMSTASTPMPITTSRSRRQWSAISVIGSDQQIGDRNSPSRSSRKTPSVSDDPVDEAVVAMVVALQHAAHDRGRQPLVEAHVQQRDAGAPPAFTSGTKITVRPSLRPRATSTWRSAATRRLVPTSCGLRSTRLGTSRGQAATIDDGDLSVARGIAVDAIAGVAGDRLRRPDRGRRAP